MIPTCHPTAAPFLAVLLAGLPLKVICAWCHDLMREGVLPVSHGICATCAARVEAEAGS